MRRPATADGTGFRTTARLRTGRAATPRRPRFRGLSRTPRPRPRVAERTVPPGAAAARAVRARAPHLAKPALMRSPGPSPRRGPGRSLRLGQGTQAQSPVDGSFGADGRPSQQQGRQPEHGPQSGRPQPPSPYQQNGQNPTQQPGQQPGHPQGGQYAGRQQGTQHGQQQSGQPGQPGRGGSPAYPGGPPPPSSGSQHPNGTQPPGGGQYPTGSQHSAYPAAYPAAGGHPAGAGTHPADIGSQPGAMGAYSGPGEPGGPD